MTPRGRPAAALTGEDLLRAHTPDVRRLVDELRSLIRASVPQCTEKANRGWHALTFHHPDAGYFCGIFPFHDTVRLVFEHGAALTDPDGVLEGAHLGQVRYVTLRGSADVAVEPLRGLLHAALHHGALRAAVRRRARGE